MIANQLYCPLCGQHLATLPENPPLGHPTGASWNPSWLAFKVECPRCGGLVNASHIENSPNCGLQVGALCPLDKPEVKVEVLTGQFTVGF